MRIALLLYPIFSLVLLVQSVMAQDEIRGSIKDTKGKPVPAATVTLKSAAGNILTFSRSNEKGFYQLKIVSGNQQASSIEVSSLGYKKEMILLSDLDKDYNFTLRESSIELPTVVVDHRPRLKVDGDTLSYKLADFSNKQDRVLGDVLKKMPGIEVDKNGKISYNGKSISNFYIDGDNLLDDKYNIATKSIPKDAVDKVQVIQNDQPIKMLRNKSISDDIALNITIKEEAKLKMMGQAELGAGVPERFNGNVNAMMFNKKYKGINYLKGNNTGNDPAKEITSHNFTDYMKVMDNKKPSSLLSTGAAGAPDLPQSRYLFNRAALLNVNNLVNLKKEVQVKTNLYYLTDRQQIDYDKFTAYELPTGNVSFTEQQHNVAKPHQFRAQASINANRNRSFLQNTFITDYKSTGYQVRLTSNDLPFTQALQQQNVEISNEFNYLNTLKNGSIYNLYSYVNYSRQPEELQINTGLNPDLFNNGLPYAGLIQTTKVPALYTNNYLSFKRVSSAIVQTYKLGFNLQAQELNSNLLSIQQDQQVQPASVSSHNQLNWNRSKLYTEGLYEYGGAEDVFTARLNLPLSYQHIAYEDRGFQLDTTLNRLFLNPSLNMKYKTSVENYFQFNYALRNELGTIDDLYRGAILRNYRSLFANNAPLSEQKSNTAALSFNFRKAITMVFFNLQASYNRIDLNTISSSILTDNLQQRVVLPYENKLSSYSLNGNISKYLFDLRTTVSMGLSWSQSKSNQFQNGILLPYRGISNGIKAGFQSKISNSTNLNYKASYNQNESKSAVATTALSYKQLNQQVEFSFMPLSDLFVNLTAEHIYTRQSGQQKLSYLFSDLSARYKINKINTDCEFIFSNIGNIKTYKAIYVSDNAFTAGTYKIPGSVAMLKFTLTF